MKGHILLSSKKTFSQIFCVIFQLPCIFTSLCRMCLPFCLSSCHQCSCWSNVNFLGTNPTWKGNSTTAMPPVQISSGVERWTWISIYIGPLMNPELVIISLKNCPQRIQINSDMQEIILNLWHRARVDRIWTLKTIISLALRLPDFRNLREVKLAILKRVTWHMICKLLILLSEKIKKK